MIDAGTSSSQQPLTVYGLGSIGRQIVDELLDNDVAIDVILDRGKAGQEYRGVPIRALGDNAGDIAGRPVLLGLNNHYVDVKELHGELMQAGAARVMTPVNLRELLPTAKAQPGYWLELDFDYEARQADFDRLRDMLADEASRDILDRILRYRRSGDLADCPEASLHDEYTPADLPRFKGPLKLVDCGAFTGVAIHKYLKAGYEVGSFFAFEPDPESFGTLASRNFPVGRGICMPLGTWSSTKQLSFSSDGSMGSALSDSGNVTIQCVAIDDVLHGEEINLVKLDVEGAELETLEGMERIIRDQRPNLAVSVYHTPGHLHEAADLIAGWDLGYRFHLRVHEYNTFGVVLYALRDELIER